MNYYTEALRKYVVFSGRARRKEFWMFALVNIIISIVLSWGGYYLAIALQATQVVIFCYALTVAYSLAVFLPTLSVAVRRLHDSGRSGAWMLLTLVPFFGPLLLFVFWCLDSQPGDNQYGPNPKGISTPLTPPSATRPSATS